MTHFFLPPNVSRELLDERAAREAEAARALEDADYRWKREFDAELQRVDPHLQLVWCPDPAPVEAVATGAFPGRWHIARHNPGAPMSLIPLTGENGRYVEPGSWVFDMLAKSDLWSDQLARERAATKRRLEVEKQNREHRERAERQEELRERVSAIRDTKVSFNQSVPWSQNVQGRRGAKRR